jgi:hypothetical protein
MPRFFLVLLILCGIPAVARADDAGLSGKRKLIVQTKQGLWIGSKHTAVVDDTLRFRSDSTRVAVADIESAWRSRPAPLRRALIGAASGAGTGAFVEIALGSDCPGCGIKATDVLAAAGLNAAVEAATNAVLGLFYGGWKEVVPGTGDSEPYPVWGGSVGGGWSHGLSTRAGDGAHIRLSSWAFRSRTISTGIEVGTLSSESETFDFVYPDTSNSPYASANGRDRTRYVYATSQLRWRARTGDVRPQWTVGLGSYLRRSASTGVYRDSTGAIVRTIRGSDTETLLGVNGGIGVGFLRGPLHPVLEARFHWRPRESHRTWVTLGVTGDWR